MRSTEAVVREKPNQTFKVRLLNYQTQLPSILSAGEILGPSRIYLWDVNVKLIGIIANVL